MSVLQSSTKYQCYAHVKMKKKTIWDIKLKFDKFIREVVVFFSQPLESSLTLRVLGYMCD